MKKIIFIVTLIAAAGGVMAQRGYYHQVGDTVRGKCPIYHYEQGWWPTLNAIGHTDSLIGTANLIGYMKHTTNTPLRVIGVASTCARLDENYNEDMDTSIDGTLYYVLSDATAGGLVERARVCWTDDYLTHPKRYMELPRYGGAYYCEDMYDGTVIVPLREYYFDSAITVTDSFYLGCLVPDIDFSGPDGLAILSYAVSHRWDYCFYYNDMGGNSTHNKACKMYVPDFIYYDSSRLDHQWHHYTRKEFQLIFPIIALDTFCFTPEEPYVASRDSLVVRVEWTDTNNLSWEVSRTAPGGDPHTGLITATAVPYIEYTDINDDSAYHVYVRGYCEAGILSGWSGWSTPCLIDSISTTPPMPPDPPVGITPVEAADITLSPNPTDGSVQLIGIHGEPASVEVLDMTGRLLKAYENTTLFSISDLSSGIYMVRVKTRHDNTDKVTYLQLVKK